jgi:hypothetical protein
MMVEVDIEFACGQLDLLFDLLLDLGFQFVHLLVELVDDL